MSEEKIKPKFVYCSICDKPIQLDKEMTYWGVLDRHNNPYPLCNNCIEVWNKHSELITEDKSNFKEYMSLVRMHVKENKNQGDEK